MPEVDALVAEYSHLNQLPRENDALHSLKKIASLVKPVMRARGWRVGTLAEFYPDDRTLLGLNINAGFKILVRLRHAGDKTQFLPLEQVVDTMLHELAHIAIGPHNDGFYALWDQLRREYEGLISKGYTGEGFLSQGRKLGGIRVSRGEAQRIARAAAEKRRTLSAGSGQRLGGAPVKVGTDIRKVIVDAIERRSTIVKGCGSDKKTEKEIIDLTNEATQGGFKTEAEEDEANDSAISQALWELVQEDEKKQYGKEYVQPTPANPTGSSGGGAGSQKTFEAEPSSSVSQRKDSPSQSIRQMSRLVQESSSSKLKSRQNRPSDTFMPVSIPKPKPDPDFLGSFQDGWTCSVCTLHNPIKFLSCDACTTERPAEITKQIAEVEKKKIARIHSAGTQARIWTCRYCKKIMDEQWWTCSSCGNMKDSS